MHKLFSILLENVNNNNNNYNNNKFRIWNIPKAYIKICKLIYTHTYSIWMSIIYVWYIDDVTTTHYREYYTLADIVCIKKYSKMEWECNGSFYWIKWNLLITP